MLKTPFLFLLLLLIPFFVLSQGDNAAPMTQEQLTSHLNKLATDDRARLPILATLIKNTWRSSPLDAEIFGQQALAIAKITPWPEQEADFLVYLTRVYLDRRDLKTAEELIEQGLNASRKTDNERTLTLNLFNQAIYFQLSDKLLFALNTYRELEAVYKRTNNMSALGNLYNNISNIQSKVGDLDGAFESLQLAMPLLEDHNQPEKYANTISNVGRIFEKMNDFAQAERNYKKALSLFDEESHPKQTLEVNQLLGVVYNKLGLQQNSLEHFINAKEIAERHKLTGKLLNIYLELVMYHLNVGEVDVAQAYVEKSEELNLSSISDTLTQTLPFFKAKVLVAQEQWSDAEQQIDIALQNKVFEQRFFDNHSLIRLAVQIKSKLNKLQEANTLLLSALSDYGDLDVSNNSAFLAQYAALYRTSEKENQIAQLTQKSIEQENLRLVEQQASRQTMFIFVITSLVLIAVLLLILQKVRSLKREHAMNLMVMQEKKQFFADISHELRTPLTVFKLKMEELEHNISENPEATYKLLHQRIESFNSLINDVSLLAQHDKGELELETTNVALSAFFDNRYDELKLLAQQANLDTHYSNTLSPNITANIDVERMLQIITNLFSNSCRYTNSPGQISLKVSHQNSRLIIEIADSAPGLPPQQRKQIFERLYRVDKSRSRKFGGSGLGLSICKDLIKAHKGTIYCDESELGGISMLITIPLE